MSIGFKNGLWQIFSILVESNKKMPNQSPPLSVSIQEYQKQLKCGDIVKAYRSLMQFMARLRIHLINAHPNGFASGNMTQGNMDYTYFPFTPIHLKRQRLKTVLLCNHLEMRFEIWLVGQNRLIQRKFWELIKSKEWAKYHIPDSPKDSFAIASSILIEQPGFDDLESLITEIDEKAMWFIKDLEEILQ